MYDKSAIACRGRDKFVPIVTEAVPPLLNTSRPLLSLQNLEQWAACLLQRSALALHLGLLVLEQSLSLAPHWALELAMEEEQEQEAAAQTCQLEVSTAPTTQSATNISRRYKTKVNLHVHSSQSIKTQVLWIG